MKKQRILTNKLIFRGEHGGLIQSMPSDVLVNILSRLPIITIHYCRCVCKSWHKLLLEPYFTKHHLARSPTCLFTINHEYMEAPCLVEHEGEASSLKFPNNYRVRFQFPPNFVVANSCHGFVCLYDSRGVNPLYYVFNPVTGEYVTVQGERGSIKLGLGFSPTSNQFKLLLTVKRDDKLKGYYWDAQIYTLGGTDGWRSIQCGTIKSSAFLHKITSLNGSLHWIEAEPDKWELINCFDFDNERFQFVPPPFSPFGPSCYTKTSWTNWSFTLGVLGGYLCLCDYSSSCHFDVWVMKDYGVQQSWTKEFAIQTSFTYNPLYQPIRVLNDGSILMLAENTGHLVCYKIKDETFLYLPISGVAHTPSFCLLKDIAMGENLEVLNVKSSRYDEFNYLDGFHNKSLCKFHNLAILLLCVISKDQNFCSRINFCNKSIRRQFHLRRNQRLVQILFTVVDFGLLSIHTLPDISLGFFSRSFYSGLKKTHLHQQIEVQRRRRAASAASSV